MDLDCTNEFGVCHDIIKKCRKDWSLAHDVKLLKYLEGFSQSLISKTGEAFKSLEDFEKDLNSLSLNIRTVSQRFQSLANKQFIEHCVLEDDVSTYIKQKQTTTDIPSSASNVKLNNALASCLSSFHLKYNSYKEGYSVSRTNHTTSAAYGMKRLPPLIGTPQFTEYYSQLLNTNEKLTDSMNKSEVKEDNVADNISDKQSNFDSLSLHSSPNVGLDGDSSSFNDNFGGYKEVDPANSSISGDIDNTAQDIFASVVNSIKQRGTDISASTDRSTTKTNGYNTIPSIPDNPLSVDNRESGGNHIINPLLKQSLPSNTSKEYNSVPNSSKIQSLFDDRNYGYNNFMNRPKTPSLFGDEDDADGDPNDLFSFAKSKPFSEKLFDDDDDDEDEDPRLNNKPVITSVKSLENKNTPDFGLNQSGNDVPSMQQKLPNTHLSTDHFFIPKNENPVVSHSEMPKNSKVITTLENQNIFTDDKINSSVFDKAAICKEFILTSMKQQSLGKTQFTLFSDHEDSDDELFASSNQKDSKEQFKKILEEKMSALSSVKDASNFSGKLSKNKYDSAETSNNDYTSNTRSVERSDENNEDSSSLPKYETPTLENLVKSRPKIKNKRRPPSRKHLKGFNSSTSSKSGESSKTGDFDSEETFEPADTPAEESSNNVSILSPSTEEEDLFVVPASLMVDEISSSNLFSASSLLSPGSSLDNHSLSNEADDERNTTNSSYHSSVPTDVSHGTFFPSPSEDSSPPSTTNSKPVKNVDVSKFSWTNKESLFNDSDDDDDLFSSISKSAIIKKPPLLNKDSTKLPVTSNQNKNKLDYDSFKDIFSNTSDDDDDLFKSKKASLTQNKASVEPANIKDGKSNESNEGNLVKLNMNFKDPLSCFNDTPTD